MDKLDKAFIIGWAVMLVLVIAFWTAVIVLGLHAVDKFS